MALQPSAAMYVLMGMKPADSDLSHCDTLTLDEKYNCQRLKHVKFQ